MEQTLNELLTEWNDPLGARTMSDAEYLIDKLIIELAGKEEVIKELEKDIKYFRKDWKDQMVQDQGLET
ncbi:MAG: hypothetical protein GY750_11295 [Lentisphaerae bacterium]|nr:hypothetical protein [Lentisphaerota bacterium]